jgi:hypothetical protein
MCNYTHSIWNTLFSTVFYIKLYFNDKNKIRNLISTKKVIFLCKIEELSGKAFFMLEMLKIYEGEKASFKQI